MTADLQHIYRAANYDQVLAALLDFQAKWAVKYPSGNILSLLTKPFTPAMLYRLAIGSKVKGSVPNIVFLALHKAQKKLPNAY